jgi:hypothetical protein
MTRNSTRPQTDIAYNSQMRKQAAFIAICAVLLALTQAQTVTVTAVPGPDETISQNYVALDSECRRLVAARQNPADAVSACKKVADEADQFAPQSHFITRRGAFVYYTTSLIQAKEYKAAVSVGDKAIRQQRRLRSSRPGEGFRGGFAWRGSRPGQGRSLSTKRPQ